MRPAWPLAALLCWHLVASAAARHQDTHNPLERINVGAASVQQDNQIKLAVSTTKLTKREGELVEVSWHGVQHPSYADWIGLLVPADANPTRTAPAKFQMATADLDATHLKSGSGRLRFRVINHRTPVQFAFFRGGLMQPVLAARSPPIDPSNPNEPLQRRLALTGDNREMQVQWTTRDAGTPLVKWGTTPGHYTHTTAASSSSSGYSVGEMCGPPANSVGWVEPGTFHSAVLQGLEPGQKYFYVVGDEEWGFSPEASFVAAPPVGPSTTVSLVALADLGQAEDDGSMGGDGEMVPSLNTTGGIMAELQAGAGYQLLVHNGDISYARGYGTQWDNYMHQMEPIISRLPYMTVPGNHERDWPNTGDRFGSVEDSGGECGVPLERRFTMPQAGPDKPWYSFDFGPIHFLQYSTEHDFAPGSEQHTFVLSDLAAVDRTKTPWLVVGGHRPIYISSTNTLPLDGDQVVAQELRDAFEEAFVQYKVDLTLHGHHHSYQRTCPVIGGKCVNPSAPSTASSSSSSHGGSTGSGGSNGSNGSSGSNGERGRVRYSGSAVYVDASAPVHLVIGNAGAELSWNVEPKPAEIWQNIRLWWGYLRIHASGTQLKCEAVSDSNGGVTDTVTLIKSEGWAARHMDDLRQQQLRLQQAVRQQQQQEQSESESVRAHQAGRAAGLRWPGRWWQQWQRKRVGGWRSSC